MSEKHPLVSNTTQLYEFPTWWGGIARSTVPPLIAERVNSLRLSVGGLEAKRGGAAGERAPLYPVKSSKELFQKLAQGLSDLGLMAPVVDQTVHHQEYSYTDSKGELRQGTAVHVTARIRLGATDGSFVELVGSGHGVDRDDKAGGKASTYAWKDAILKGLTIPEQDLVDTDDEEGQGAVSKPIRKKKAAAPATQEDWKERIAAAKTVAELEELKTEMRAALPMDEQLALSPPFRKRMGEFTEK
jgi:hypothetical protein